MDGLPSFEQHIEYIAGGFVYPSTPPITIAGQRPRRTLIRLSPAMRMAAAILILLAGLMAIPPARAAILDFLHIGAIQIEITDNPPTSELPRTLQDLEGAMTLAEAQEIMRFDLRLPPAYGEPDYVYANQPAEQTAILVWVAPGDPQQVILTLYEIGLPQNAVMYNKNVKVAQNAEVNGFPARWIDAPHVLEIIDPAYLNSKPPILVNANVLIWYDNRLTYRLETDLSIEEAVAIAESLE
jgi:hypothetical protein